MRNTTLAVLILLLVTPVLTWADQTAGESSGHKISRWESDLSAGPVLHTTIGIVKTFRWYPLPKIFALGMSFDFVGSMLALSLNLSLNLPLPVVVPFVCAGAGSSISRGGITNFGGGLKFRIWPKIGIIVEYRKYSHKPDPISARPGAPNARPDYIGAGITYIY